MRDGPGQEEKEEKDLVRQAGDRAFKKLDGVTLYAIKIDWNAAETKKPTSVVSSSAEQSAAFEQRCRHSSNRGTS